MTVLTVGVVATVATAGAASVVTAPALTGIATGVVEGAIVAGSAGATVAGSAAAGATDAHALANLWIETRRQPRLPPAHRQRHCKAAEARRRDGRRRSHPSFGELRFNKRRSRFAARAISMAVFVV